MLVYVDNIIIFSKSKEKHLYHLSRILQLLKDSRVTLSIAKYYFSYPSIKALRHYISQLDLSMVEEKTEAIQNLNYPRNLRDLETVLGFFRYYRKFVPHYSVITQPLLDLKITGFKTSPARGQAQIKYAELTKYLKDGTFPTDCKVVWNELKECLYNALTLAFLDFSKDLIIYIDSSKECSYGAALHQKDNEKIEQPVLFLSKVLNAAEKNYWVIKLEVSTLVWTLNKLQQYMDMGNLTVYTDDEALKAIFKSMSLGK